MSRTKRAVTAVSLAVIVLGTGVAPVAVADRYTDMQCFTNPAYRSMHEECEGGVRTAGTVAEPGRPGSGGGGGLSGVLRSLPVVGGLF